MNITTEIVTVTPELAQEWLDNQISTNRPVREKHVRNLQKQIVEDRWALNGEAFKFNREGKMLDGQHRCRAIIRAGKPIQALVVRDLPQSTFSTLDGGAKRGASDYLVNEKHRILVAAAAKWMFVYASGKPLRDAWAVTVTSQEILEVLELYPDLSASVAFCVKIRLGQGSFFCFLHYVYSSVIQGKWSKEDVDKFFTGLHDGKDLSSKSPCFLLREVLIRSRAEKKTLNRVKACAMSIKAIKLHLAGKSISFLKWSDTEAFPELE